MITTTADAVAGGQRLRQAREAAGVSLEAMAGQLKVPSSRLASLEAARLEELPDLAFARALAQAQCRLLRVDPDEVLALLPRPEQVGRRLEHVNAGLTGRAGTGLVRPRATASFRSGRRRWPHPVWVLVVAIALAGLWTSVGLDVFNSPELSPSSGPTSPPPSTFPDGASQAGAQSLEPSSVAATSVLSGSLRTAPEGAAAGAVGAPVAMAAAASGQGAAARVSWTLAVTAQAWVRVADADDRTLLERTLSAGETLELDSRRPLRLELGNASASVLMDMGRQVDLAPWTRDNVARLVLE